MSPFAMLGRVCCFVCTVCLQNEYNVVITCCCINQKNKEPRNISKANVCLAPNGLSNYRGSHVRLYFCGTIHVYVLCKSLLCNLDRLRACLHGYSSLLYSSRRKPCLWQAALECGWIMSVHTHIHIDTHAHRGLISFVPFLLPLIKQEVQYYPAH